MISYLMTIFDTIWELQLLLRYYFLKFEINALLYIFLRLS